MTDSTPGWQPDPTGKHDHRYWDGSQWTDNVSDAGVASTDPYEAGPAAEPAGATDATVADAPAVAAGGTEPPAPTDPTTAWPAAPAAPAPPPPYTPAGGPPPPAGGGGSKRGLLVGGGILAAIAIAVIAFLALGGDDEDSVRTQLASKLEEEADGELTSAQAECVADLVVDEAGEDAFDDVDFDASDTPEAVISAFIAIGQDGLVDECDVDPAVFGGSDEGTDSTDDGGDDGSDDGGDDAELESLRDDCADGDFVACDDLYFAADIGSDLEEFGSTCGGIADPQDGFCTETNGGEEASDDGGFTDAGDLPDNFLDTLVDTYENMGLERDQAECLATKIVDAIEGGELSEEEAMSDFMGFFSDCDIDPSDLSGN